VKGIQGVFYLKNVIMANKLKKEKYDGFLVELIANCNKKIPFKPAELMAFHGVSNYSVRALVNLGFITPNLNGTFSFTDKGITSVERITDAFTKEISRIVASLPSNNKRKEKQAERPPQNAISLNASLDNMMAIMDVGIKYGVHKESLKDFVREIMILKLSSIK
jgi:hypothetical protein